MFAICLESSHQKGMGHLFRMLNFIEILRKEQQKFIFLINQDLKTKKILENKDIYYEVVDLYDYTSNWESLIVKKYNVEYWINDRLNTDKKHTENVLQNKCKLITFDDLGSGAKQSDINICGLFFNKKSLTGKKILKGIDYLILNPEIDLYKKLREKLNNILVTFGGSDTYGITIKILKILKKNAIKATIHIGPSFEHIDELNHELTNDYKIINYIPSLIKEFSNYDLAITGAGITPFEANASGLPCLIVSSEVHELDNGKYLDSLKSSLYLGHRDKINNNLSSIIQSLNIPKMSEVGLNKLNVNAAKNIYKYIRDLK
ncbi:MAG: hypothetical protein AB7D96_03725 [Arcobacteraceae bacterium]